MRGVAPAALFSPVVHTLVSVSSVTPPTHLGFLNLAKTSRSHQLEQ